MQDTKDDHKTEEAHVPNTRAHLQPGTFLADFFFGAHWCQSQSCIRY
jgi:hypothetical protein